MSDNIFRYDNGQVSHILIIIKPMIMDNLKKGRESFPWTKSEKKYSSYDIKCNILQLLLGIKIFCNFSN